MSLNALNKAKLKIKITGFFKKTIPFLILIPVFMFTYFSLDLLNVDNNLLGIIIAASSIIVALIIGFLFNSYFNLKQIRLEKLSRFAELQNKLRPYQEAFFCLAEQLAWRHGNDMFQFPRPFSELLRDQELWKKDEYVAIIWQRAIREASTFSSQYSLE